MKLHFTLFRPANKLHQSVRAGKVLSCLVVLLRLLGRASNYFTQCLNQSSLPGRRFMLSGAARRSGAGSCAAGGRGDEIIKLQWDGGTTGIMDFVRFFGFRPDRSKA